MNILAPVLVPVYEAACLTDNVPQGFQPFITNELKYNRVGRCVDVTSCFVRKQ